MHHSQTMERSLNKISVKLLLVNTSSYSYLQRYIPPSKINQFRVWKWFFNVLIVFMSYHMHTKNMGKYYRLCRETRLEDTMISWPLHFQKIFQVQYLNHIQNTEIGEVVRVSQPFHSQNNWKSGSSQHSNNKALLAGVSPPAMPRAAWKGTIIIQNQVLNPNLIVCGLENNDKIE